MKTNKVRTVTVQETGEQLRIHELEKTGRLVPCPGEAHGVGDGRANGHVDNCGLCAPRWGQVEELKQFRLQDLKPGFAVALAELSDDDCLKAVLGELDGYRMVHVVEKRRGCTGYYNALRVAS